MENEGLSALMVNGRRRAHRAIRERWVITADLKLETPAHFGAGEDGDFTDMPVLLDEVTQEPLLPGSSIAGALRNYLREVEAGDGRPYPTLPQRPTEQDRIAYRQAQARERRLVATHLFGFYRGDEDDEGVQSPLVVHDAPGKASGYELRDGVAIDGKTGTVATNEEGKGKKFDLELLAAGTTFQLRFELAISIPYAPGSTKERWDYQAEFEARRRTLLSALATTLNGLSQGEITLGARKRRGCGQCSVVKWTVQRYDLTTPEGLLSWLASERGEDGNSWTPPVRRITNPSITAALAEALGEPVTLLRDSRQRVTLTATLAVASSILIRSGFGQTGDALDMVHLHSRRSNKHVPIVPGTSWAGVLRHRALKIGHTTAGNNTSQRVKHIIESLFGPAEIKKEDRYTRASRLAVSESEVTGGHSLVQTRVSIDRFTGGALEAALFEEQPLFGNNDTIVTLELTVKPPSSATAQATGNPVPDYEIGLLLLLLKDLWTGDLRVGGESAVGRGQLRGIKATLSTHKGQWTLSHSTSGGLAVEGNPDTLEKFVDAFVQEVTEHE